MSFASARYDPPVPRTTADAVALAAAAVEGMGGAAAGKRARHPLFSEPLRGPAFLSACTAHVRGPKEARTESRREADDCDARAAPAARAAGGPRKYQDTRTPWEAQRDKERVSLDIDVSCHKPGPTARLEAALVCDAPWRPGGASRALALLHKTRPVPPPEIDLKSTAWMTAKPRARPVLSAEATEAENTVEAECPGVWRVLAVAAAGPAPQVLAEPLASTHEWPADIEALLASLPDRVAQAELRSNTASYGPPGQGLYREARVRAAAEAWMPWEAGNTARSKSPAVEGVRNCMFTALTTMEAETQQAVANALHHMQEWARAPPASAGSRRARDPWARLAFQVDTTLATSPLIRLLMGAGMQLLGAELCMELSPVRHRTLDALRSSIRFAVEEATVLAALREANGEGAAAAGEGGDCAGSQESLRRVREGFMRFLHEGDCPDTPPTLATVQGFLADMPSLGELPDSKLEHWSVAGTSGSHDPDPARWALWASIFNQALVVGAGLRHTEAHVAAVCEAHYRRVIPHAGVAMVAAWRIVVWHAALKAAEEQGLQLPPLPPTQPLIAAKGVHWRQRLMGPDCIHPASRKMLTSAEVVIECVRKAYPHAEWEDMKR